jgi:serine/threonine-protein kinase SRPK3
LRKKQRRKEKKETAPVSNAPEQAAEPVKTVAKKQQRKGSGFTGDLLKDFDLD